MKINIIFLVLVISFIEISCEYHVGGGGMIVNKNNVPIENAQILLLMDNQFVDTSYSDKFGKFDIGFMTGMIISSNTPKSKLIITAKGYNQTKVDVNDLEKKDSSFKSWKMKIVLLSKSNRSNISPGADRVDLNSAPIKNIKLQE